MRKKGDVVKNWKKRYFVLAMATDTTAQLKYFVSPDTTVPKGTIGMNHFWFPFFILLIFSLYYHRCCKYYGINLCSWRM